MTNNELFQCKVPNCDNRREVYASGEDGQLGDYYAYHGETEDGQQESAILNKQQ